MKFANILQENCEAPNGLSFGFDAAPYHPMFFVGEPKGMVYHITILLRFGSLMFRAQARFTAKRKP